MLEERAKTETTAIARMTNLPTLMRQQLRRLPPQTNELTGADVPFGLLTHPIFNAGLWITNRIAKGMKHRVSCIQDSCRS
jgi:hypothetical protein